MWLKIALAIAAPASMAATPGKVDVSPAVSAALAKYNRNGFAATRLALQPLAAAGDLSAHQALGELLNSFGDRSPANLTAVCDHFERAGQVRGDSAHNLAFCYEKGSGRSRSLLLARRWYERAASLGSAKSSCALGNMLVHGQGGAVDAQRGVAMCRRGAEAGDADAQTDLAGYLLTGVGGPPDPVTAAKFLTSAAERGHVNAAMLLGTVYWNADGVPRDKAAAARWWRQAHEGGRKEAAFLLAQEAFVRMMTGTKGPQDLDPQRLAETIGWYELAQRDDPDETNRRTATAQLATLAPFREALRSRRQSR